MASPGLFHFESTVLVTWWGCIMEIKDRIKELRRIKASELVPNPKNWRRHNREQSAALKGLLTEIGYAGALLARELPNGKLILIDGHLRAETTPKAIVPVLVLDVSEAEADKILLTYDPLTAMATADSDAVKRLLETVRTESRAVGELLEQVAGQEGWQAINEPGELVDPPAQIDKAAELQAKWGTAFGQVWAIGAHRIMCGDSTDRAHVGRLWAHGGPKLRMVWTDPPYGVDYAAKNAYLNRSDRGNRIQRPIENDRLTAAETGTMFKKGARGCKAICRAGSSLLCDRACWTVAHLLHSGVYSGRLHLPRSIDLGKASLRNRHGRLPPSL